MQKKNSLIAKVLSHQPVERTPVWIMRQAGRYLPEYRKVREKAGSFMSLCKNPELAAEVTLQPINRFPLDAAIIFSDILTIPDAMGMGLYFKEGKGPCFKHPVNSSKKMKQLPDIDPDSDLHYALEAIRLVSKQLPSNIPLIGFSGSPWTLATYMIEGESSKTFSTAKKWLYLDPLALHSLLNHLTKNIINYLQAQINAGADIIMIFDTWGGILADNLFLNFSLHYMQLIVTEIKKLFPDVPIILFTKNGGRLLKQIANTGCNAIGLDWLANMQFARSEVGDQVILQGNLDPSVLFSQPEFIKNEVSKILNTCGKNPAHIFNLGHGIEPKTPVEHVSALIEAIHTLSPLFHKSKSTV